MRDDSAGDAGVADLTGALTTELRGIALVGCAILLIGFCCLGLVQTWGSAAQWLLQATVLWSIVCWQSLTRLHLNRLDSKAPLYASLGPGNRVTILRGGLIALAGGFLFQDHAHIISLWLPAVFYMSAAIIDRVDGYIARRSGQVSLLGTELDTAFDALGLVVAPLLAVGFGKVHWSYLSVSMAYYLFLCGLAWRKKHNLPVYDLVPNFLRRALAGFQMGFLAVVLWPNILTPLSTIAGVAFMLPVLAGFVVDWLTVSGRLRPTSSRNKFFNRLEKISRGFFQPLLRALLAGALITVFLEHGSQWWEVQGSTLLGQAQALLLLFSVAMIVLGFFGRLGALFLIVLLGWHYPGNADSISGYLVVFSTVWIMILGSGLFSVYQWDDEWVNRHDGA